MPAVLGYNMLLRRNKIVIEKLRYFATDLHAYLFSGARVGGEVARHARGRQRRSGSGHALLSTPR